MKTDCTGCRSRYYTYEHITNLLKEPAKHVVCGPLPNNDVCPCSTCLVKMICNIPCKNYDIYRGNLVGEYHD